MQRTSLAVTGLLVTALVATFSCKVEEEPAKPPPGVAPPAPGVKPPVAEEAVKPPRKVAPNIYVTDLPLHLRGPIVLQFPWKAAKPKAVGKRAGKETVVEIEPEVAGDLFWKAADELTFRLEKPLAYGTDYVVRLVKVDTVDGVREPAEGEDWSHAFSTPEFELRQVGMEKLDRRRQHAKFLLTFNGRPQLQSLHSRIKVFIGEERIVGWNLSKTSKPSEVRLKVAARQLGEYEAEALTVAVEGGVRAAEGEAIWIEGGEWTLSLNVPGHIKITRVKAEETASGFLLEVRCEDDMVRDKRGYIPYYEDSCPVQPGEVAEAVQIRPPVPVSVSKFRRGFKLAGDFKAGAYVLTILSGLTSSEGGVLTKTFEKSIRIPHRSPSVGFVSQGRYLPRTLLTRVPVSHINVDKAKLSVRKVHPQNLVFWLTATSEVADDRTSDEVASYEYALERKSDVKTTTLLDLSKAISSSLSGVFELRLTAGDARAVARLVLTNLTLVAKRAGQKGEDLQVWVLESNTLDPLSGAGITLMSKSNRKVATCRTDSEGGCRFKGAVDTLSGKAPIAIVARHGDDLSFLEFEDLQVSLGDEDVQGRSYDAEAPYTAAIYSDRGVYRPGETAHLVALLRTEENVAPAPGLPALAKFRDPREKMVSQLRGTTDRAGMVAFDFQAQAFAATGQYKMELEVGGKRIAGYRFNVEEFVPERMKVKVKSRQDAYLQSQQGSFDIEARYLFGAKAAGERVELSCSVEPTTFKPPRNKDYSFNPWSEEERQAIDLAQVDGELDEEGVATLSCPVIDQVAALSGPGRLTAMASVFEAGSGRTTTSRTSVPVHADTFYLGLRTGTTEAKEDEEVQVDGVVVDWEGKLLPREREVEVVLMFLEREWSWEWEEDDFGDSRQQWRRHLRPVLIDKTTLKARKGRFDYTFTPTRSGGGGYLVRARAGGVQSDLMIETEDYYWWEGPSVSLDQTPKPQRPMTLPLDAPAEVKVGEAAAVTFKPPYAGRALFTVETNRVLESRWLKVEAGETRVEFTVKEFVPNVYVSVLLIKDPHQESKLAYLPGRAFGVRPIKITPERHALEISVKVPKEVRPNSELVVELTAEPGGEPMFATVAAVDEGILQLTRFRTPDVLGELFSRRALGVSTFETVGWTLLVPPLRSARSPGGDEEEEAAAARGRIMPVKTVALWSGVVEVPASGKARVKLEVPQYRGELRVMVVAASRSRAGSVGTSVTVRDPLVLGSTFPRFLLSGDRFVVPVFVTNLTGKKNTFTVEFTAGDGVAMEGETTRRIRLARDEAGTVTFVGRAQKSFGGVRFAVKASGGGFESRDDARLPFLPNAPVTRENRLFELEEGENNLLSALAGWVPETESTTVWVTANPYGQELSHLKYLVRYPYGCIEQTTSSTRPLLHIGNLISSMDPAFLEKAGIAEKFMHGVNRLLSMQTTEGGFSYWPGEQAPTYWGTAYVTHVFLEGRDAGYPIPEDRLEDALRFTEQTLTNNPQGRDAKYGYSVAKSEPYMQFVLAKAGRGRKGRIRWLIKHPGADWGELIHENIYLLKAALYLAGDRTYEKSLRDPFRGEISDRRTNGWSFWSELRTRGMQLGIMEDLFPQSKDADPLARAIAARLRAEKRSYGFTTQELSWTASGLGKRVGSVASAWAGPKLVMNGKARKPLPKTPGDKSGDVTWQVDGASGAKSFGLALDELKGRVYAMVTVEGVKPKVPFQFGDESLKVRRDYRSSEGEPIAPSEISLGDLVYVELTLTNLKRERIQNVALVDRFAAGLEIENPRLGRSRVANWIDYDELWDLSYMNMRDDRIELFGHLAPRESAQVVYTLRAVTAGEFSTPPVRAEAMYEPRYWSSRPGKGVRIGDPWEAM